MQTIVNATPLIYLAKLGKLDLAKTLYPDMITTPQVRMEVLNEEAHEYTVLLDAFENWIRIEEVENTKTLEQLQKFQNIHVGEASIIALAIEKKESVLIFIDDKSARIVAKSFGFTVSGTLGIIVDALLKSMISNSHALQLVDQLALHTPFRMSLELYKFVINKIKEIKIE